MNIPDHRAAGGLTVLPVTGLGEFGPGSDLAGAILAAAPWLADDDIVVVTSKVISRSRTGCAGPRPEERETRAAADRR